MDEHFVKGQSAAKGTGATTVSTAGVPDGPPPNALAHPPPHLPHSKNFSSATYLFPQEDV
jgi:hypothetical protein